MPSSYRWPEEKPRARAARRWPTLAASPATRSGYLFACKAHGCDVNQTNVFLYPDWEQFRTVMRKSAGRRGPAGGGVRKEARRKRRRRERLLSWVSRNEISGAGGSRAAGSPRCCPVSPPREPERVAWGAGRSASHLCRRGNRDAASGGRRREGSLAWRRGQAAWLRPRQSSRRAELTAPAQAFAVARRRGARSRRASPDPLTLRQVDGHKDLLKGPSYAPRHEDAEPTCRLTAPLSRSLSSRAFNPDQALQSPGAGAAPPRQSRLRLKLETCPSTALHEGAAQPP